MQEINSEGSKVTLSLSLPPDFPVGSYRLEVEVQPEGSRTREKLKVDKEMVVIFNPWCKGSCTCTCVHPLYIASLCFHFPLCYSLRFSPLFFLLSLPLLLPSLTHLTHCSTEDAVFLPKQSEREEYILNESGTIWAGAYDNMFTWPWNFAQVTFCTCIATYMYIQ